MAQKCYGLIEDKSMSNTDEVILQQESTINGKGNSLGPGSHFFHS